VVIAANKSDLCSGVQAFRHSGVQAYGHSGIRAIMHSGEGALASSAATDQPSIQPAASSTTDHPEWPVIPLSALTGDGLDALRDALAHALGAVDPESIWVSNARHQERLMHAQTALDRAIDAADGGFDHAAIAHDLRLAAESLGEITGETVTEETISQIFARFCVGK
jgi:tRNA U34 5-carboxymethylaminomethyl modifying GTPase MnmE/TrmE